MAYSFPNAHRVMLSATLCLATNGAMAQETRQLVQPKGSAWVRAASHPKTQDAQFAGTVVLHGFLVARWLPNERHGRGPVAHFHLLPAPESALGLPHFEGHPVTHLSISQGMKVLAQATSPAIAKEFAGRRHLQVHAEGLFSLRQLRVDAACLSHASVRVEQVDPIGISFQASTTAFPGCAGL